jgi:uncharacterized glyoxalase superfamily protein PhnB
MKLFFHLNFAGNCAQAFRYYEENLGGKILALMKQSEAPGGSRNPEGADPVLHARMELAGLFWSEMMYRRIVSSRCAAHTSTLVSIPRKKLNVSIVFF